jgi:hypothetical protein
MMEKKKYQKPTMEEYKIREKINLLAGSPGEGGSGYIPGHNINDDMNHLA